MSEMKESPGTLRSLPNKKAFKVSILFAPIYVPVFFLAAAISIPLTFIDKLKQRRQERKFAEQMREAGRLVDWQQFKQEKETDAGTAIAEYLSPKGPFRLWWTPEDVSAASPHIWKREQHYAWMEEEFRPFFEWCYARYTNPRTGLARLVAVPEGERKRLKTTLTNARFVSTCSFRSVREKSTVL